MTTMKKMKWKTIQLKWVKVSYHFILNIIFLLEETIRWEVDDLLQKKYDSKGEVLYEVKWKGSDENTWEPKRHLDRCETMKKTFQFKGKKLVIVKDMQKVNIDFI